MSSVPAALQDMAAPDGVCFGCGSSHPEGLQLKSYWDEDGVHVVCRHMPDPKFHGWPGLVYGGLVAMLVDCHSNWTAMAYHYRAEGREPGSLPRIDCVTGKLNLTFIKPTPMGVELTLKARVEGEVGRKSRVICEVWAGDVLTVTADSIFVRVDTEQLKAQAHGRA
ncbi:PaaI family thioesterase [Microbulbifer thermotolerans]|uniref:Acyl-coenzyme A thioesterase THEM4 n=1 Tax=Microbulbifer thermotolerans TaxID=252514 RepID=A0AB35HZD4_MICTH|nr:PaaI family thioesterase [Microbulbifer thermotolerans]MCX2801515.1 PaaI family thioesterase [Microbulbifer thermotolerans]